MRRDREIERIIGNVRGVAPGTVAVHEDWNLLTTSWPPEDQDAALDLLETSREWRDGDLHPTRFLIWKRVVLFHDVKWMRVPRIRALGDRIGRMLVDLLEAEDERNMVRFTHMAAAWMPKTGRVRIATVFDVDRLEW